MTKKELKERRRKQRASIEATRQLVLSIRAMSTDEVQDILAGLARHSWSRTFSWCDPLNKLILRGMRDLIRRAHKGIDVKL